MQILINLDKRWQPAGTAFKRFVADIRRVWPGPGVESLTLQQVGVTVPLGDVNEPIIVLLLL